MCVRAYLPIYISTYLCLYELTHINKFLSCKYSLYAQNKDENSICTSKFWLEDEILFWVENQVWQPATDFESGFLHKLSGVLRLKNTKVGLSASQDMLISPFGKWACPMNKNEEQPGGFAGRIFDNLQSRRCFCVCVCVCV